MSQLERLQGVMNTDLLKSRQLSDLACGLSPSADLPFISLG